MDYKKYIPDHDMSKYMVTQKLMESGYLLANKNISVYVDTVKPRIFGIHAYGKFGRLHQMIYDVDVMEQYNGLWGIIPSYYENGLLCLPFFHVNCTRVADTYKSYKPSEIIFDADKNILRMKDIKMYDKNNGIHEPVDFTVSLADDRIRLMAMYPEKAEIKRMHLPWYPLFDKYVTGSGEEHYIEYYSYGYEDEYFPHFKKNVELPVVLKDSNCRQAGIRIETGNGKIEIESRTVPEIGNTLKLSTDIESTHPVIDIALDILQNPVTVKGNPYYPGGDEIRLDLIMKDTRDSAKITCDYPASNGQILIGKQYKKGENTILLKYKDSIVKHSFFVMEGLDAKISGMADACINILWKDGKLKGIVPQAFDLETLKAIPRSGLAYCSHGMRIIPVLNAAAIMKGDVSYTEEACNIINRVIAISHRGKDNSIFTPIYFDHEAKPAFTSSSRPSDQGIIIKGLLYCADGFMHFGREEAAKDCIRKAYGYFKTIRKMQCEDGSFWSRYYYPSAEPNLSSGEQKGTVNNWCMQLWNLAQLMKLFRMEKEDSSINAGEIVRVIEKFIDSQLLKSPSILEVCGGGEDPANFGDALNTASTYFTMKYLLTGDETYKEYTRQALYKAWLTSCFYIDMPQFFSLFGFSELGEYYNQPDGLLSFGGMHCLTAIEANLFACTNLNMDIGLDIAKYIYFDRLATFVKDNGGIYMVVMNSPNYFHREEKRSEALMYGGVGVFSHYLVKNR